MITPQDETAIWARLMDLQPHDLTPETARYLLRLGLTESDKARMLDRVYRSQAGTLTEEESREFDSYLHIRNFLALMQSKARLASRAVKDRSHSD